MHCFLIVGAGRSGTSLMASLFRNSDVAPVSSFEPRTANPLGFYEDIRVNKINESILSRLIPRAPIYDPCGYGADTPSKSHYWLARINPQNIITANKNEQRTIQEILGSSSFCIKDPRLSYTHHCWHDCLSDTQKQSLKSICIFRNPAHVLNSVLHDLLEADYLQELAISKNQILANWTLQHQWIIEKHINNGQWFFCEYEELVAGTCADALRNFCQIDLDFSTINPQLNRSAIDLFLSSSVLGLYRDLQQRAADCQKDYQPPSLKLLTATYSKTVPDSHHHPPRACNAALASRVGSENSSKHVNVAMTLLCRNEIDIIQTHIDFHLSLGVDYLLVTDNASTDGTRDLLEHYEQQGKIVLIKEEELIHDQAMWVTRMANIAREDLQVDWLLHSDADEFWLPKCLNISAYFQTLDPTLKQLEVPRSNMLPPPMHSHPRKAVMAELPFYVKQLIREVDSLDNLGNPILGKVCHRSIPGITVQDGNHGIKIDGVLQDCSPAIDFEIIHFPVRNLAQLERKIRDGTDALMRNTRIDALTGITWRKLRQRLDTEGSLASYYSSLCMDPTSIRNGLQEGTLVREDRIFKFLTRKTEHCLDAYASSV